MWTLYFTLFFWVAQSQQEFIFLEIYHICHEVKHLEKLVIQHYAPIKLKDLSNQPLMK